mmetsp:Transcript_7659/g.30326  ORF Transcript_7659/g.30326 Transcript_7659/m.30326 type:complete len:337 (-) Transcript_7659:2794-3804(-)
MPDASWATTQLPRAAMQAGGDPQPSTAAMKSGASFVTVAAATAASKPEVCRAKSAAVQRVAREKLMDAMGESFGVVAALNASTAAAGPRSASTASRTAMSSVRDLGRPPKAASTLPLSIFILRALEHGSVPTRPNFSRSSSVDSVPLRAAATTCHAASLGPAMMLLRMICDAFALPSLSMTPSRSPRKEGARGPSETTLANSSKVDWKPLRMRAPSMCSEPRNFENSTPSLVRCSSEVAARTAEAKWSPTASESVGQLASSARATLTSVTPLVLSMTMPLIRSKRALPSSTSFAAGAAAAAAAAPEDAPVAAAPPREGDAPVRAPQLPPGREPVPR